MNMDKLLNLPVRASEGALGVDQLIHYIHLLMMALFIGWLAYFLYALWRFRQRPNAPADYHGVKGHTSSYIEVAVVGVEAFLLVMVALPLWRSNVAGFPDPKDATVIQVMGQQFAWNFRYPGPDGKLGRQDFALVTAENPFGVDPKDEDGKDDLQLLNEIHVPVNKPVIAHISSKDVIHSFRIMAMRVTQDAIPGTRVPIWFKPTKEGRYQVYCAQLCGNGHAAMAGGYVVVESQEAYERWLASKTGGTMVFE